MSRRAQSKVEAALNSIGRRLIGGYRTRTGNHAYYDRSKYLPHQGGQEALRRMSRRILKEARMQG